MKKCDKCNSNRILEVIGKVNDFCSIAFNDRKYNGYPELIIDYIATSDYLEFKLCLNCGKIQGNFPVSDPDF